MKILSMTATFGKLEHATLELTEGLNIIHAPNEWGKSTWCAFMVNMLYGIDTRARSTGTVLADKERYAPWSGAAMSGRMDIVWQGRKITLERSTKGRTVFGEFRAYETDTGLDVPELDATTCGQRLLGVERSVFTRAGFLKLTDLPVTQDDALRRRLNNLVTTGDESGAGDKLGQTLKDLKNKCRFNNSGLLPQAENERDQLKYQLQQLTQLTAEAQSIRATQTQLVQELAELENHQTALEYADAQDNVSRVQAAQAALQEANDLVQALENTCKDLAEEAALQADLENLEQLLGQRNALFMRPLPELPSAPTDLGDPQQLLQQAQADHAAYLTLSQTCDKPRSVLDVILGILTLGILPFLRSRRKKALRKQMEDIARRHPGLQPEQWIPHAQQYHDDMERYAKQTADRQLQLDEINREKAQLEARLAELTHGQSPEDCRKAMQSAMQQHKNLADARVAQRQAQKHAQALQSMIRTVDAPKSPDKLTLGRVQTQTAIAQNRAQQQSLQLRLGQCLGQAENIGQESLLKARLDTLNRRIARLEDTYHALELAQEALYKASTTLQRRFAPMIAKHTQELFGTLTDGRYQRLTIAEDLSLSVGAQNEDTLHSAQWRSDGTVDQLYLALRLAVARELTPHAPLVLDDALVRFDDTRLAKAMQILNGEAQNKQVILFTCQRREEQWEKPGKN